MVGSLDDIRRAKEYISAVREDLDKKNIPCAEIKTGIMIEVPSIALVADLAVREVDFASIGSNDLCQYLCAADRMNSAVETYCHQYHPAMFRLIKKINQTFTDAGKPISICGELGGDSLAAPVLIGLGMRKLSMSAASVAEVKRVVASITLEKAEKLAEKVLELPAAADIELFLLHNSK
jgi:phosphotransferase system enzyme I (PtsI)